MASCPICLEELNGNIQTFCCSTFHKPCIISALKVIGKCPICRCDYKGYTDTIKENTNNLDQIKYEYVNETNKKYNGFLREWRNITADLVARIYMLEERLKSQRNNTE